MEKRKKSALATFFLVGFAIVGIVILAEWGVEANKLFLPFALMLLVIFLTKISTDEKEEGKNLSVLVNVVGKPKVDAVLEALFKLPGYEHCSDDLVDGAYRSILRIRDSSENKITIRLCSSTHPTIFVGEMPVKEITSKGDLFDFARNNADFEIEQQP